MLNSTIIYMQTRLNQFVNNRATSLHVGPGMLHLLV